MSLEAIAEIGSVEHVSEDAKETIVHWNGRDLNALHQKHQDSRISSVALQRARFNNDQTGYILCKIERYSSDDSVGLPTPSIRDYHSTSKSKGSNDKTSQADAEESEDEEAKTDTKQSISFGSKYDRDNHGHSSNQARLRYKNSTQFKNGTSLDIEARVSYERHIDRNQPTDRTSGEIDASYTF